MVTMQVPAKGTCKTITRDLGTCRMQVQGLPGIAQEVQNATVMMMPRSAGRSGKKSLASATPKIQTMTRKYNNTERHIANYEKKTESRHLKNKQPMPHKTPMGSSTEPLKQTKTRKQRSTRRDKRKTTSKRPQLLERGNYRSKMYELEC
jgi:hypothetical protein